MSEFESFRIDVPEADLDDLRARLARARVADGLPGVGWSRGVPPDYLAELARYWREDFDWRAQETRLNAHEQFLTDIDGQRIHLYHVRSPEPDALPLLITHGYPGSVVEFADLLGQLADPKAHGGDPRDAFHLVVPSLPGFGYSSPLAGPSWHVGRTARAWVQLMKRLGYDRYGLHGGDIGAGVSGRVGAIDRDRVVGVHVNSDVLGAASLAGQFGPVDLDALTEPEKRRLDELKTVTAEGKGYYQLQSTRPQTVSYALTDSPIGQLAWIAEKFKEWTNPVHELPEQAVGINHLLTNVSLYWFTATAPSAANFLYEASHTSDWGDGTVHPRQGWAVFGGREPLIRKIYDPKHEIAHWTEFDEGGHFVALETPQQLIEDIRTFFRPTRPAPPSA